MANARPSLPIERSETKWRGDAKRVRDLSHGDARIGEHRLEDRRLLSGKVEGTPGDLSHPTMRDAPEATFRDCVFSTALLLVRKNVDAPIVLIDDLENVTAVAEITRLLTPEFAA